MDRYLESWIHKFPSVQFPDDDNVTAKISVSRDYTIQFKPTLKGTSASSSAADGCLTPKSIAGDKACERGGL